MVEAIIVGLLLFMLGSIAVGRLAEPGRRRADGSTDHGSSGAGAWGGDPGASGAMDCGDAGGGDGGGGCD